MHPSQTITHKKVTVLPWKLVKSPKIELLTDSSLLCSLNMCFKILSWISILNLTGITNWPSISCAELYHWTEVSVQKSVKFASFICSVKPHGENTWKFFAIRNNIFDYIHKFCFLLMDMYWWWNSNSKQDNVKLFGHQRLHQWLL